MKAIKFAASALTLLALAVSSGCQVFHAPRHENLAPVTATDVSIEATSYFLKLKDPKATDVDWDRLKQDILAQVPAAGVTIRDFYKGEFNQSQEIHLTADVTPAVMRKALARQGELAKETDPHQIHAVNSTLSSGWETTTSGMVPPHCSILAAAPGTAKSSRAMKFMPVIRGTGDVWMYYAISSGLEISPANAEDLPLAITAPDSQITERTSITLIPQGESMAVSGLRMQIKDPKTKTYADGPDNEVQIVVVTPTIGKK
jgi:hypothetical protein